MKSKKTMTTMEAWFLLIAGLFMGTVFTFGMQYWNAPVTQEDAIHATVVYSSYTESRRDGHVKEIIVRFEDHDQLYIDGSCINEQVWNGLDTIAPGMKVDLLIHPNSNTILDFRMGNSVVLEFENTSEKLASEATGFGGLGLFLYILAAYGLFNLVFQKRRS